jgi:IMP dehydrogenase/GMP reductase
MKIEEDIKLDFKDVLIKPKRSQVCSRAQINLIRTHTTMHTKNKLTGIPLIASNMDATGTFAMAKALNELGIYTCLHKHYPVDKLVDFYENCNYRRHLFYTMGVTNDDFEKLKVFQRELSSRVINLDNICIDVSNGYSQYFLDRVKRVREIVPFATIMAGNVVTPEMVQELLISGAAEIVKIGIGPGCFTGDSLVLTKKGFKKILDIIIEDEVLTHRGRFKKVKALIKRKENKKIIKINGIKCTENHEFYVLDKKYVNLVNDENMHQYAEWIEAKDINKNYLLLKISDNHLDKIGIELDGLNYGSKK